MIGATDREPSDRDVLRASLKDPARFGIVFDRHFRSVYRFLERQVGATAAEDLAAETFTVAFAQRRTFDARRRDVRPWLFGIAINLLRNHRRAEVTRRDLGLRQATPEHRAIDEDPVHDSAVVTGEVARVAKALARIDDESRALLLLVASTDFNIEQAAESLHISPAATRTRLWRARQQLRAELGASNRYTDESSSARDIRGEASKEEQ
ncbi:MAG: RNA polymerase sigma factor [Acidimicrobiales bacterium]|jgi:RNA polymerase sigma-70 factor (ECF subfamily)